MNNLINVKYLSLIIMISILLVACGQSPESHFRVTLISNGSEVRIEEYVGRDVRVGIPRRIQNLPVTEIGYGAFFNKGLVAVRLPKDLKTIGEAAFLRNNLTVIRFPKSVRYIGNYAFGDSRSATSFSHGKEKLTIGCKSFYWSTLSMLRDWDSIVFTCDPCRERRCN